MCWGDAIIATYLQKRFAVRGVKPNIYFGQIDGCLIFPWITNLTVAARGLRKRKTRVFDITHTREFYTPNKILCGNKIRLRIDKRKWKI